LIKKKLLQFDMAIGFLVPMFCILDMQDGRVSV